MSNLTLEDRLFIRVLGMDNNGMSRRLGVMAQQPPKAISVAASVWSISTAIRIRNRGDFWQQVYIEMITLPCSDLASRLGGHHDDFREPLVDYVDRLLCPQIG